MLLTFFKVIIVYVLIIQDFKTVFLTDSEHFYLAYIYIWHIKICSIHISAVYACYTHTHTHRQHTRGSVHSDQPFDEAVISCVCVMEHAHKKN
jgi:hypothetical protein